MSIIIKPPASGGGGGGAVSSVNGKTGAVTLDTDDILEPGSPTNEWFTVARALAAVPSIQDKTTYVNVSSADIQAGINAVGGTNEAVILSPGIYNSSALTVSVNNKDYLNIKSIGGVENSPNAFIGDSVTPRGMELTGTTNKCRINGLGIYGTVTLNSATGAGVANNRFHNCHFYNGVTVANAGTSPLTSFVAFYDCELNADVTINAGVTGLVLFVRCSFIGGAKIINSTGAAAKSLYMLSDCAGVHADNVASTLNREVTLLSTNTASGQTLPQLDAGAINCTALGSISLHSDVGAVGTPSAGDVLAWDGASSFTVQAQASAPVTSVAGKTGIVTLSNADITGLGTAAVVDTGTGVGNVPALTATGLPAISGQDLTALGSIALHSDVGAVGTPSAGDVLAWDGASSFTIQAQAAAPVTSVAGKTGIVTLSNADITGLGTAAVVDTGTAAGNAIVLDGSARLPAVDGSQLTGISGGGGGAISTYSVITADPSPAVNGTSYLCNTAAGAFNVTLPAAPSVGDQVEITRSGATHAVTVLGNGKTINGAASLAINADGGSSRIRYWDATYQWVEMS